MKYKIIYADPPWSYDDKAGAERHYKTMAIDEIKSMPIANISDNDSILFMWATYPKLREAFEVISSWGFEYKTVGFVWVKTNKREIVNQSSFIPSDSFDSFWGMGRWTRSNSEVCLLAVKGKPKRLNCDVHSIIYSPIAKHSRKPEETKERILRLMGDLKRIELFARKRTNGWDVFGNEVKESILIQ